MIGEIRQNFTEASALVGLILATVLKGELKMIDPQGLTESLKN